MAVGRVSTAIYLGDKLVKPIFGNQFMGINPFSVAEPTPVLTDSVMILDATSAASYPGTGNTWTDLSGNGNNADVSLVTSYWNSGGYFDWPGSDYTKVATVADAASLDVLNGDFTFLLVGTIDTAAGGFADLVGPYSMNDWNDNPGMGWLFVRNSADGNYRKMNFYLNATGLGLSTSVAFNALGDWFVIHVVRSGSTVTYYNTANTSIGSFTSSVNANNNNGFTIGRGRNDATTNYRWDGKMAGIGLYDKALTSDERLENINYFKDKLGF
jgi:hypothetical protein